MEDFGSLQCLVRSSLTNLRCHGSPCGRGLGEVSQFIYSDLSLTGSLYAVLNGHDWGLSPCGWVFSEAHSSYSRCLREDTPKVCSVNPLSILSKRRFSKGYLTRPGFLYLRCGQNEL